MRAFLPVLLVPLVLWGCSGRPPKPGPAQSNPVANVYFGVKVDDPYRNIENLKDPEVEKWFKAQSDYARAIINRIPGRQGLIDKMREFDGRRSTLATNLNITESDHYFYLKSTPTDEVAKLYVRKGFEGTEELLYDPASFSTDTTKKFIISSIYPTHDGTKVAFEIAPNGSESSILLTMDMQSRKLYPEQIDRCWDASSSWVEDNSAFLYNRLQSSDVHNPDREKDSKTYLHVVGTDPAGDKEIFSRAKYPELGIKPETFPIAFYDRDSKILFGMLATVDRRMNVFMAPASELGKERIAWKRLFRLEDEVQNFATTDKDLYVYTAKKAPNFRILKTSIKSPDLAKAEVVVPEDPKAHLNSYALTKAGLFYTLSTNGVKEALYHLPFGQKGSGKVIDLPVPAGSIALSAKGYRFEDLWTSLEGWTTDSRRYRYVPATSEFKREQLTSTAEYLEYADLIVEEVDVPSHDGVEVPLSIIYKKGIKRDGSVPALIRGYGSYGFSSSPKFSPNLLLWTHHGGILAVAHVRGGGEKGDAWHMAGYKTMKPNTWKDLIACAEYLVKERYTSPANIAIFGRSAGGILIGRAMTERPDLFSAAIPEVGELNPLRAENSPNGPVNAAEFGTVKDSAECMALIEMDSYLKIMNGTKYPAALITAGMNDPRVIAWEPGKFAARLEAANGSGKPILFLVDYSAGHGHGDTKAKQFENLADALSFGLWQTGQRDFQP